MTKEMNKMNRTRRQLLLLLALAPALPASTVSLAQNRNVWSVKQAYTALQEDRIRLLDIRSPKEWHETGIAQGAWPVSMHDMKFMARLGAARELAEGRPIALICATGNRSGLVARALRMAGHDDLIDVSEGMLGSGAGPGWIRSGLPVISIHEALAAIPSALS